MGIVEISPFFKGCCVVMESVKEDRVIGIHFLPLRLDVMSRQEDL